MLIEAVVRNSGPASALLIAVGLAGLLALPLQEKRISFDEKSLMVGNAHPSLRNVGHGRVGTGMGHAMGLSVVMDVHVGA